MHFYELYLKISQNLITEVQSNQLMNFSRWTILLYCLISENIDSKTSK